MIGWYLLVARYVLDNQILECISTLVQTLVITQLKFLHGLLLLWH